MGLLKRIKGDLYLGYRAAVIHPLKRLFLTDERTGKERFLANYAPEGLIPTSLEDRAILEGASRCIDCGLCEAYELTAAIHRSVYDGASLLPLVYSRATSSLPHAAEALDQLREHQLARAEAVCPTRVPLRGIAGYLRRKLAQLQSNRTELH